MILNKFRFVGVDMDYKVEDCFLEIRNGISIKQGIVAGGFPITRIETLADDKFNRDRMGYAGITEIDKYSDYVLEDGDLLMSHINSPKYLGRTVVYHKYEGEVFIHGMNLLKLRTNRDILCPDFAEYLFASFGFRSQISKIMKKSVNQASFSVSDLRKISVKIPSLSKQREIINKLHRVKQIVNDRNIQLEMFDELIKSRFVEMFYDKGYPVLKWNDVFNTTTGKLDSNAMVEDGEYPFFTCAKEVFRIDKYAFDQETLLLAGNNAAGKYDVKYYKGKFNAYQRTYVLGLTQDWSYRLFQYQLEDKLVYLQQQSLGGLTKYLTLKILGELEFIIPTMDKQNEFTTFTEQVDKLKVDVHKSLCETQVLFDSLMKKYFG